MALVHLHNAFDNFLDGAKITKQSARYRYLRNEQRVTFVIPDFKQYVEGVWGKLFIGQVNSLIGTDRAEPIFLGSGISLPNIDILFGLSEVDNPEWGTNICSMLDSVDFYKKHSPEVRVRMYLGKDLITEYINSKKESSSNYDQKIQLL